MGIVLLDEIFAANPARILALQGILEGEPFIVKQTGERITPAPGFNIIATDNSRGDGSESGKYIGVNIQNFAFLERFAMCIDHDFPSRPKELKMLEKYVDYHNIVLMTTSFLTISVSLLKSQERVIKMKQLMSKSQQEDCFMFSTSMLCLVTR